MEQLELDFNKPIAQYWLLNDRQFNYYHLVQQIAYPSDQCPGDLVVTCTEWTFIDMPNYGGTHCFGCPRIRRYEDPPNKAEKFMYNNKVYEIVSTSPGFLGWYIYAKVIN